MKKLLLLQLGLLALLSLLGSTGCGGGGGGGGSGGSSDPIPTGTPIVVSGIATYDSVPPTGSGLDYAATVAKPIRNAIIEVRTSGGTTVLFRALTDEVGSFSVQAPSNATVRLTVLAALGPNLAAPTVKVVDNTAGLATYATFRSIGTLAVDLPGQNLHAASGFTIGTGYTAPRSAAPFAILDVAKTVVDLLDDVDPGVAIPALVVGWSFKNTSTTIGTSSFSPSTGRVTILGHANVDTDEYDTHVIAHEIGHWFEANFSRADSIGGSHGNGDILDETVAFGEGFGNAFSGMVTRDAFYRDTSGPLQGSTGLTLDLEADSVNSADTFPGVAINLDGGWSEISVQEILWDIFDGTDDVADGDTDGVALGFGPIYDVLVGPQRTTPGFTTIYSFLTHLKNAQPAAAIGIDSLAAGENIGAFNSLEQTADGRRRHTVIPTNGSEVTIDVDNDPLTTYTTFGNITADYPGNRLYNWLFFTATLPSSGSWRIRATPDNGSHDVIIRAARLQPGSVNAVFGGAERLNFTGTTGQVIVFAVGSFAVSGNFSGITRFTVQLGSPAAVGKPQSSAIPVETEAIEVINNG